MRLAPVLLLLLALPLVSEEGEEKKPPPDPVKLLPKCLQPGAKALFGVGMVSFRTEKGEESDTVRLVSDLEIRTGEVFSRVRFTAVLDARSRSIRSKKNTC